MSAHLDLQPDREIALAFVKALTGSAESVLTFQTFREAPGSTASASILHGTVNEVFDALAEANRNGAEVFFAVNERDGMGRRAENVIALRALFADDDQGNLDVYSTEPVPGIVVYSSRGKLHVYWPLKSAELLAHFSPAQRAIAATLGTDPVVHDLARVMRLPGFFHLKSDPQLVTFDLLHADCFAIADVLQAMGGAPEVEEARQQPDTAGTTPDPARIARARAYIAAIHSVEGQHGNSAAFKAAASLLRNCALPRDVAWELLMEWNATNASPPWDLVELGEIFANAEEHGKHPRGALFANDHPTPIPAAPSRGIARYAFTSLENVEEEEQTFLWDGFLPDGAFCLIEGNPDAGKTFMALDLAAKLSTGRVLPDGEVFDVLPRQRVLFLTAEDSISKTIVPRLKGCGADLTNVFSQEQSGDALLLPGCIESLREVVRERSIKVVVFDALNNYLDASRVKVNDEQKVRQALKPVRDLAAEENVTIIGLRHLNKKVDVAALMRGAGSIALAAVARSVLLVARHPDDPSLRIVVPQKGNLVADGKKTPIGFRIIESITPPGAKVRAQLAWNRDVPHINADELLAPPKPGPRAVIGPQAEQFLRGFLANGPRSRAEVLHAASGLGLNDRAVERAATALGVTRDPNGKERVWSLPANVPMTDADVEAA